MPKPCEESSRPPLRKQRRRGRPPTLPWSAGSRDRPRTLAKHLEDGKPCPVCGSAVHPRPAKPGARAVDDAKLKALTEQVREAEKQEKRLAGCERTAAQGCGRDRERHSPPREEPEGPQGCHGFAALKSELAKMARDLAAAEEADEHQEDLLDKIEAAQDRERELKRQLKEAESSVAFRGLSSRRRRSTGRTAREAVPEAIRKPGASRRRDSRRRAKSRCACPGVGQGRRKAEAQAGRDLATCTADRNSATTKAAAAANDADSAEKVFSARVTDAGFSSVEDYTAAKLPAGRIRELETAVTDHEQQAAAAKERQERAAKAAEGLQAPDMEKTKDAANAARDEVAKAVAHETTLGKVVKDLVRWGESLDLIAGKMRRLDAEHGVIGRLAEVASGKNPRRISFQRFVQAIHLDRVLQKANQRLRAMTGGRYILQRAEEEENRQVPGGLSIVVLDNLTQKMRPVNTLSGGETFQASLSLALGLADVVTSRTGGVRLDTIFVDEGFGSLDSEALDLAISTLQSLEHAGRTVGIISHVPELRERFAECRLQITPARRGSHAEFVLG